MTTQEQKLKYCVEKTGGKWHEVEIIAGQPICKDPSCGCFCSAPHNPSPTDLNALFKLTEKAFLDGYEIKIGRELDYQYVTLNTGETIWMGDTSVTEISSIEEALLSAIFVALGGNDE